MRWDGKTIEGYDTYLDRIARHFPTSQTLDVLVYYSRHDQAQALRSGAEHWRER
ncbi:MAG: hypothetical protein IT208_01730 [Chthonomonadales bacterium]|nr:hypothetical protein [Chthonomonadales bacterium]